MLSVRRRKKPLSVWADGGGELRALAFRFKFKDFLLMIIVDDAQILVKYKHAVFMVEAWPRKSEIDEMQSM